MWNDFSFPRTESKVGYGHRGFVVHTDEKLSFKEAALRRDFTINAMGMELPELTLCDPYGGIDDLKTHTLRHVGPAFAEDSLRILRGVQFASRFGCTLAPSTVELCRTLSLDDLSIERLFEEFKKWLLKPGVPSLGLKAFLDIKLDEYFSEIHPFKNSWETLGTILDNMVPLRGTLSEAQAMEFAFAALLCGCAETSLKFLERITNETRPRFLPGGSFFHTPLRALQFLCRTKLQAAVRHPVRSIRLDHTLLHGGEDLLRLLLAD